LFWIRLTGKNWLGLALALSFSATRRLTDEEEDDPWGDIKMSPGDPLKTSKPIRSQKTGVVLPREGTFVRMVENMGRQLILVNFGAAGYEYIFPDEIIPEIVGS
jgi:hypothetical protein